MDSIVFAYKYKIIGSRREKKLDGKYYGSTYYKQNVNILAYLYSFSRVGAYTCILFVFCHILALMD